MKRSLSLNLLVASLVLLIGATGCKHGAVNVTKLPNGSLYGGGKNNAFPNSNEHGTPILDNNPPISAPIPIADPTQNPQTAWTTNDVILDPAALAAQTIHFDLDSATIKSSEESKLSAVAEYLKTNPKDRLLIEGNCDERGTEGYNLSLGERRSLAAREKLLAMGIAGDRVNTISYGESRPASQGHDESAWKQNRRDDFVVGHPK